MPPINDEVLFNFLLSQKSVTQTTPFDFIEKIIDKSIKLVNELVINAHIINVALNIDNKLVVAQVYVERLNGFAPTKENKFGANPTAYNVQIRFPFGLEMKLGQEKILVPSSDFKKTLSPYYSSTKVSDDVMRDFSPNSIETGPGIEKRIYANKLVLKCMPHGEELVLRTNNDIGKGYVVLPHGAGFEYSQLEDYQQKYKTAGVYPLFYTSAVDAAQGSVKHHPEYKGYTIQQRDEFEPRGQGAKERKENYEKYIKQAKDDLLAAKSGQEWLENAKKMANCNYLFNITVVNGTAVYTESGLPVYRLRDYQLELFKNCQNFINDVLSKTQQVNNRFAGKIAMGVGAGKTFFTFTLLQYLKYLHTINRKNVAPSFCLTPDEALAEVTKKSIKRQGHISGMTATAITKKEQMPDHRFIQLYQKIAETVSEEANDLENFLTHGLQNKILEFCDSHNLHPHEIINILYEKNGHTVIQLYKESIDHNRLLLLVEAQKTIRSKTGMLSIAALTALLEQFEKLNEQIISYSTLFNIAEKKFNPSFKININYDQLVDLPYTLRATTGINSFNIMQLDKEKLLFIINKKNDGNKRAIRDALMRIACLKNSEAAVLLANSGGLGNTSSAQEMDEQIKRFLPDAFAQLNKLLAKSNTDDGLTNAEHYVLYLYLTNVFSTIPEKINLNDRLDTSKISRDNFKTTLYQQSIESYIELAKTVCKEIKEKIDSLSKAGKLSTEEQDLLKSYNISPQTNLMDAASQLAGFAALQLTGNCEKEDAELLLSNIPIFTPEGLASYFEHLASLEGKSKVSFKKMQDVYSLKNVGKITKKDIATRLQQLLNAIMIADEVHKEEYRFLFDNNHPLYQRITRITQKFFNKEFKEILPHRIGMSGTMNSIAEQAFSQHTLYDLSSQKMIKQGLMKKVSTDSYAIFPDKSMEEYAKDIVVHYFTQPNNLSVINVLTMKNCAVDLFQLSKGLLFSKVKNDQLNALLLHYFNILIKDELQENDKIIQEELLQRINEQRRLRADLIREKLNGNRELSSAEIEQIHHYNLMHADTPIKLKENCIENAIYQVVETEQLNPQKLREIQYATLKNNLYAVYMEYILSKTGAIKEMSDIIGVQNNLFEKGTQLIEVEESNKNSEAKQYNILMRGVDPQTINQVDVSNFINERIKDKEQAEVLIHGIMECKNDYRKFVASLDNYLKKIKIETLVTSNRHQFEGGKALVLLATEKEQTGYSHEQVGIIVDIPSKLPAIQFKNSEQLLRNLQEIIDHSFSFNEKNQVGGRALRTPYGHVRYVQYQTQLNAFLAQNKDKATLQALKVEVEFQDIFTSNEDYVQKERASIGFNRQAISLLKQEFSSLPEFVNALMQEFAEQLKNPLTSVHYNQFIKERAPLLWSMKYQTELAANYLGTLNDSLYQDHKQEISTVLQTLKRNSNVKAINKEQFFAQFEPLKKKIDILVTKGDIRRRHYDPQYVNVGKKAAQLKTSIETAANAYFDNEITEETTAIFKKSCIDAIQEAQADFGTHRGWGAIHWSVRALLGVLIGATGFGALGFSCLTKQGYCALFFGNPPTDSAAKLQQFENSILDDISKSLSQ